MKSSHSIRFFLFLVLLLLPALACDLLAPTPTEPPPTDTPQPVVEATLEPAATDTPEPTPEPTVEPTPETTAVTNLQDVRQAVVQIEAQGTFVDPQLGVQLNQAGFGSGFIIDPSGTAVTNNHVVTGAAALRVYVAGEDRARNARVLGASECADLAVIQIDGDDFAYLEWFEGAINVGLDVYAAGFPLGDPEFTLTRGVVSKERALAVADLFGVDGAIEHDATINPGNSGGPLVDSDGRVVAVNFAGSSHHNQYFAIARNQAVPLIAQLADGHDVYSIGINGIAVTGDGGLSGIWVSSVKSGSPADEAGVLPGDIITHMEGLKLATDGTMADYCSILRSRAAEDTLAIEVLRLDTEEVLAGQINGRVLEPTFSFARELDERVTGDSDFAYSGYVRVYDDTESIVVEIPQEWRDVDGGVWIEDGEILGASITAAANINRFYSSWTEPGMLFIASELLAEGLSAEELLDFFDFSGDCAFDDRYNYSDPVYAGVYDIWFDCGGTDTILVSLAAMPDEADYSIYILIQVVTDADLDALDRILATFLVVDQLPSSETSGAAPAPAPTQPPAAAPAPTQPPANITGALLQAMRSAKTDLERMGGLIDHAINVGSIDCNDVVNTYDRIANAPTFNVSGASVTVRNSYDSYRQAIAIFANGGRDMAQNCRDFLANPSGGSIPFQQWGTARQSVNDALDRLNPAINNLQ